MKSIREEFLRKIERKAGQRFDKFKSDALSHLRGFILPIVPSGTSYIFENALADSLEKNKDELIAHFAEAEITRVEHMFESLKYMIENEELPE